MLWTFGWAGSRRAFPLNIRPLAARIRFMHDTPESPNPSAKDWPPSAAPIAVPPGVTGALVMADGSVFWGKGLGARGRAVGEVCLKPYMTGYQARATDPSYPGKIDPFPSPNH